MFTLLKIKGKYNTGIILTSNNLTNIQSLCGSDNEGSGTILQNGNMK
jgi:hypothetical protein